MTKFILKSCVFFIIIAAFIKYTSLFIPLSSQPGKDDFMAIMVDKHRIAERIKSPKLILVGGSNLAFGIDSKILQKELNIPTANMGLHAGLGVEFMLNQARYLAKKNDVIIISIEHFLFTQGEYKLQKHTSKVYPYAYLFYNESFYLDTEEYLSDCRTVYVNYINTKIDSLKKYLNLLPKSIPQKPIFQVSKVNIYSRQATNADADIVAHLEEPLREQLASEGIFNYRYWEGIDLINAFAKEMKKKGIYVCFVFPNYPQKEYLANQQPLSLLEQDLKKNLTIDVLGHLNSFVYPNDHFYDTHYHLNKIGRKKRTEDLVKLIKKTPNTFNAIEHIRILQ